MDKTTAYDRALTQAAHLLAPRIAGLAIPAAEIPKVTGDALNNTWVDGLTVPEWVDRAAQVLGLGRT